MRRQLLRAQREDAVQGLPWGVVLGRGIFGLLVPPAVGVVGAAQRLVRVPSWSIV